MAELDFSQIAGFLNIPKAQVEALAESSALPGRPSEGGWETTWEALETWFIGLTGTEWADLVGEGILDELKAEAVLMRVVSSDDLASLLRGWEADGLVAVRSLDIPSGGELRGVLVFESAGDSGRASLDSVRQALCDSTANSLRNQLEVAFRCESILGRQEVVIELTCERISLSLIDRLAHHPQRDREIVRFYLGKLLDSICLALSPTEDE